MVMKKLSARWVPRLLTMDHKRNRVTISIECLLFQPFVDQDNARVHKCVAYMAKFYELRYEFLPHPPYSPD